LHYRDVWLCSALTNISAATFTYGEPPIIIAHIRHVLEGSETVCDNDRPQLSDIRHEIFINSIM
jgi:hypothetical protein